MTISKHAPRYFISRPLNLIIFNYQKSKLLLLFFLKRARPDNIDRAVPLGHFEFKLQLRKNPPLLRSYYENENFFFGEWPILQAPASKSLPGATRAKLAALLHADHRRQKMTLKDPKARLAAELALPCHRLQEQFPCVPASAMSQKQAQSGRRLRPRQLLDGS
jgi:hypothetical protein